MRRRSPVSGWSDCGVATRREVRTSTPERIAKYVLAGFAACALLAPLLLGYVMGIAWTAVDDLETQCSWDGDQYIPFSADVELAGLSFWPPGWRCEAVLPDGAVIHGHVG